MRTKGPGDSAKAAVTGLGLAAALCALGAAGAAAAPVTISGPVPGQPILGVSAPVAGLVPGLGKFGKVDLPRAGYVTEEFFLSGAAVSYQPTVPMTADGNWQVAPLATAPFTTRIIVVRPTDPAKFNGTVVMEWLNVSLGVEIAPDWNAIHRELVRGGFAYIGVSVQKAGIDGGPSIPLPGVLPLRKADPARYGPLNHPGDGFAYDIFSQAGRAVRGPAGARILGPLVAKHVLATGESQSAIFLTTYVNAIDPVARIYDGFLIHSRFGGAAPLDGSPIFGAPTRTMPGMTRLRSDLRVPVITLITETDLIGLGSVDNLSTSVLSGFVSARQPDNRHLRIWEIAGASHTDTYNLNVAAIDSGSTPVDQLAAAYMAMEAPIGGPPTSKPINSAPQHHYVVSAALWNLDLWVREGKLPPEAPRLKTTAGNEAGTRPTLVLDANGNAEGGIRTPWVDVPVMRLSGLGHPNGFGVTEVFDQAHLDRLYPKGRAEYLEKFNRSLDSALKAGFILPADSPEIRALAAAMYPITKR